MVVLLVRDTAIPLYLWIRACGSINNIKETDRLHKPQGYQILYSVLTRYFRRYKRTTNQAEKVFIHAVERYETKWQFLNSDHQFLFNKRGYVKVRNGVILVPKQRKLNANIRNII